MQANSASSSSGFLLPLKHVTHLRGNYLFSLSEDAPEHTGSVTTGRSPYTSHTSNTFGNKSTTGQGLQTGLERAVGSPHWRLFANRSYLRQ